MSQGQFVVEPWEERALRVARELKASRAEIASVAPDKVTKKQLLRHRQARNAVEYLLVEVPDA